MMTVLQILLLGALGIGLVFIINTLRSSGLTAQTYPPPESKRSVSPQQNPYPGPKPTSTETMAVTSGIPQETQNAWLTLTPADIPPVPEEAWVTFPPPAALTNPPGPLTTPVPLILPEKDSSGSITFLARDQNNKISIDSLSSDTNGVVNPNPISSKALEFTPYFVYPSANGQRLAFVGKNPTITIYDAKSGELLSVNSKSNLRISRFLGWHPDGNHLLVDGGGGLFLINLQTGEHAHIMSTIESGGSFHAGAVTPDGQEIIATFSRGYDDPSEVWIVSVDGKRAEPIYYSSPGGSPGNYVWSPDNQKVAFCDGGLKVMDADGSNVQQLDDSGAGCIWPAVWSPDSRMLAAVDLLASNEYNAGLENKQPDATEIFVYHVADGSKIQLATQGSSANLDPTWSPDGSWIAFVSVIGEAGQLWISSPDGSEQHPILTDYQAIRFPTWHE